MTYDDHNKVVSRTLNGTTRYFIYDGWSLIAEYNSTGDLVKRYVHGAGIDEILVQTQGSTDAFYHHDALGSTVLLTNASGNIVRSYEYDVFGQVSNPPSVDNLFSADPYANRFLYTGREFLKEANLYDYRNRVYSPDLGRFLQTDPIRFSAGDVNLYRYVGNNPINDVDSLGLINWSTIGSAFEGNIGVGLGLRAEVQVSKLKSSTGARYTLGSWGNLGGQVGSYIAAEADLIKISVGKHHLGLGVAYNLKTQMDSGPDSCSTFTEKLGAVAGYKYEGVGGKSNDWFKVGASAKIGLVDLGVSVNFGTIWKGLWE
jgi:RHS repeat-associated protein